MANFDFFLNRRNSWICLPNFEATSYEFSSCSLWIPVWAKHAAAAGRRLYAVLLACCRVRDSLARSSRFMKASTRQEFRR